MAEGKPPTPPQGQPEVPQQQPQEGGLPPAVSREEILKWAHQGFSENNQESEENFEGAGEQFNYDDDHLI